MPEGHTIHRHARLQTGALAGAPVRVSSPQGETAQTVRAAREALTAAWVLNGRQLARIDAFGKHLLYRFEDDATLHVHLGLFGRFRTQRVPAQAPRGAVRLRLEGRERVVDLAGATASHLIDCEYEESLLGRLGPDPLRPDANPERAWQALARRRTGIGAAILDQRVIAGIGNVYRAEILFACGIDPMMPANALTRPEFDAVWKTTVAMMRLGERSGRIVTVPASEAGGAPSKLRGRERVQVYRRTHCRRCGTGVRRVEIAARNLFWCPSCQPRRRRRAR